MQGHFFLPSTKKLTIMKQQRLLLEHLFYVLTGLYQGSAFDLGDAEGL